VSEDAKSQEPSSHNAPRMHSEMARSTHDTVVVRGFDLTSELMGKIDLGGMAFLELTGRLPDEGESIVFNAMLVSLVEHGITPSTIAARLTYLGAPEALQGAVAAGILGVGSVFVGTIEGAARMLQEALQNAGANPDLEALAAEIVTDHRSRRQAIPGFGHPIHKPVDPRAERIFELAERHGLAGEHVRLVKLIQFELSRQTGRSLPINVTGAIGAIAGELGIPWSICRGLGIMARSIGLVGHLLEEMRHPIANEMWRRVEDEAES
jgi:citrate synthase